MLIVGVSFRSVPQLVQKLCQKKAFNTCRGAQILGQNWTVGAKISILFNFLMVKIGAGRGPKIIKYGQMAIFEQLFC